MSEEFIKKAARVSFTKNNVVPVYLVGSVRGRFALPGA